jgi:hypothetical protein
LTFVRFKNNTLPTHLDELTGTLAFTEINVNHKGENKCGDSYRNKQQPKKDFLKHNGLFRVNFEITKRLCIERIKLVLISYKIMKMKKITQVLFIAFLAVAFAACNGSEKTEECKEDCKKECCTEKDSAACVADCEKACCKDKKGGEEAHVCGEECADGCTHKAHGAEEAHVCGEECADGFTAAAEEAPETEEAPTAETEG